MRNLEQVLRSIHSPNIPQLPAPTYTGVRESPRVMMAMEGMRRHVTDEGWQQSLGLQSAGYRLVGHNIGESETYTPAILAANQPGTMIIQDKREWDGRTAGKRRDPQYAFRNIDCLRDRKDIFKLTVLKDSHQDPD